MAGIFGFLMRSGTLDPKNTAKTLLRYSKQNFSFPSNFSLFDNDTACLGFAHPFINNSWPLKSKDGNFVLQIFGEIFLLDGSLLSEKNFEQGFIDPFVKSKKHFLNTIDGNFVFALYNKSEKIFILCNDPFSNFAIHYCYDNDLFIFSTQMHGIREVLQEKQWDVGGLHEYIGLGYTLGGRTIYRNIKRLQPAEMLSVYPQKILSTSYHVPQYNHNEQVTKNMMTIKNSVISSIKKRIKNSDSAGAALTGGFDSRVTWAIIKYLDYKENVTAFTHGMEKSRDITIAKRISKELDLNHIVKIFDLSFIKKLPSSWEFFTKLTEGMVTVTSASAIQSWELGSQFYNVLLDSHGGALYRRQFMKVAEKRINNSEFFSDQVFNRVKSPLLNFNLLDADIKQSAISSSKLAIRDYFNQLNQIKHPGDKIDLFYIHAISGNRYSFAGNAQMNWVQLAHPFLNLQSFNAVQEISPKYRRNHSIYRYIVSNTYPALKSFYLENMGLPAPYFGFIYFRYFPMAYELIIQKLIRPLSYSLYQKLSLRKFVSNYDMFFRQNMLQIRDILLRQNNNFFGIINKPKLELFLKIVFDNKSFDTSHLSNLITLKLFYDIFHSD